MLRIDRLRASSCPGRLAFVMLVCLGIHATDAAAQAPAAADAAPPELTMERMGELSRIRREAGLKICRDSGDGKLRYAGFVQDSERDNIKVQIAAAIDKASGQPVDGFTPVNVWDSINNWSICSP